MNMLPFDSNMQCSSKYKSPVYIDMKTNNDIYQCTNTDYLKFNYKDSVLTYNGVNYFNNSNPYYLNLYFPDNTILYKNEIYTLLYVSFNLPGTHKLKFPKKQKSETWQKTVNELAILDDNLYETPTFDLEINFVHYNEVNKKMVVINSECVSDRQFIDEYESDKIKRLWDSVDNPDALEKYIEAYKCSQNSSNPEFIEYKKYNESTNLKTYCNIANKIDKNEVLDVNDPNNFRAYVILEYLNRELLNNIKSGSYYGLNLKMNPIDLLPLRKHHFLYSGSWQENTQCYDNVVRIVFPEKLYISKGVVTTFESLLNNIDNTTYGNHPNNNTEYELFDRKILKNLNYSYSNMEYTEKIANVKCTLKSQKTNSKVEDTCSQTVDKRNLANKIMDRFMQTIITLSFSLYTICLSIVIIRYVLTKFGGPAYIPQFPK